MDSLLSYQRSGFSGTGGRIRNMQEYYIYILASKRNGTLYVGMTRDLAKRAVRHKDKNANQFTAKYDIKKLVYYEKAESLEKAVKREKELKKWNRRWKIRIIEQFNPEWEDLSGKVIREILFTGPPAENQGSNNRGQAGG